MHDPAAPDEGYLTVPMLPADLNPPIRLLAKFQDLCPGQMPEILYQVPGRDLWIAARLSDDDTRFTLANADLGGAAAIFTRQTAKQKRQINGRPLPKWARYPAGVVLHMADQGIDARGIEAVVGGDEPPGPRYEYTLCLAFGALWHELAQRPHTPAALMHMADEVTRTYVETG